MHTSSCMRKCTSILYQQRTEQWQDVHFVLMSKNLRANLGKKRISFLFFKIFFFQISKNSLFTRGVIKQCRHRIHILHVSRMLHCYISNIHACQAVCHHKSVKIVHAPEALSWRTGKRACTPLPYHLEEKTQFSRDVHTF
mmetsp:Transcript_34203/g.45757  ORF Transcript_34203/g.45757 Transcript_34203/m.45757 type:complete len:140 (-) Transcript_34203:1753-2172(-)